MKDIERRLMRLESIRAHLQRQDSGPSGAALLQTAILALHRGGLEDGEAIIEGHARALCYESFQSYKLAAGANDGDWLERHNAAWDELCAEHGLYPDLPASEQVKILADLLESAPYHVIRALKLEVEAATGG